jgi:hypothetical protein
MINPNVPRGPRQPTGAPEYVTEISVPSFGDGGIQRLCSHMREPEPEADAELEAG